MTPLSELLIWQAAAPILDGEGRLLWLRTVAEGVSALSWLATLAAAAVFLRRRRDLPPAQRRVGAIAVAFLLAGFLTHLLLAMTLWRSADTAQATVSFATAAVSLSAAVVAWSQVPKLLAQPSPSALARSNAALAAANASLESAMARRTSELERVKDRFELALSNSKITVYTQDADLRHTWLHNPQPGLTPTVVGAAGAAAEPPEALALKREALATGRTVSGILSVSAPGEGLRAYDLTVSPTRDRSGAIDGLLCTAVDVTEQRQFDMRLAAVAAQASAASRRFELALEDSPITVFEQDDELRYTFVHNPPPGTEVEDFLGRGDAELFAENELRKILPAKRRVIETGERDTIELDLEIGGAQRFLVVRLEPKTDDKGATKGVIATAVDLTERRRHEQNMRLVMRELTHRSKNLLAVVQAMARKTASLAPDPETFVRDFSSRLGAIAAAHDILVAESWSGAELRDLLTASLAQTVDPGAPEIGVEGPALKLSPDAAQMLGLAFHELTMNAARYGALSIPGGRVSVRWRHDAEEVRLFWREEGGPAVVPPRRSGFGRILLERLVGASLGGSVALDFRPEGLVCELVFPDDRLIAA